MDDSLSELMCGGGGPCLLRLDGASQQCFQLVLQQMRLSQYCLRWPTKTVEIERGKKKQTEKMKTGHVLCRPRHRWWKTKNKKNWDMNACRIYRSSQKELEQSYRQSFI